MWCGVCRTCRSFAAPFWDRKGAFLAERTSWGGRQNVEIVSRAEEAKASRRADEPVRSTVSLRCVFVLSDPRMLSPSHNICSTPDQPVGPVRGLGGKISNPDSKFTTQVSKFTTEVFDHKFTTLVYSFQKKINAPKKQNIQGQDVEHRFAQF